MKTNDRYERLYEHFLNEDMSSESSPDKRDYENESED